MAKQNAKWFYPAQGEASEELRKQFESVTCNFQLISDDRVLENFQCVRKEGEKRETVQVDVLIVRHGSDDNVSVLVYELKYLQGWKVEIEKKKAGTIDLRK